MPQKSWVEGGCRLAEGGAVRPKAGRGGPEPRSQLSGVWDPGVAAAGDWEPDPRAGQSGVAVV